MFGIEGIEAVKFGSGVMGVEAPVDGGSGGISLRDRGSDLPPEGGFVGDALLEAGAGQHAELDFRHIQPTPVLGGVVELQPFGDPAGLRRWEGLRTGKPSCGCSDCPGPAAPPRPPDRPRPPAIASVGQSPLSCAVGSPPRVATRPAAHRSGTGCGRPRADTRSPAAAEFRAGAAEPAASGPTTGWRSRQSRPPAFAGHRVPRIGPALPPCAPRSRRSPWGCTTLSSTTA